MKQKNLLIVDDNDKYARLLEEHFAPMGYTCVRAVTGLDGDEKLAAHPPLHFDVIVTDITMESQAAGIFMLGRIKPSQFNGTLVVASTGFDVFGVMPLSRLFFRRYGVHYLVPKTTVIKEEPLFYPMALFSKPTRNFVELTAEN
ncbi:MAG: response regulator [bacterium]|nr:response regulator [bacterium]